MNTELDGLALCWSDALFALLDYTGQEVTVSARGGEEVSSLVLVGKLVKALPLSTDELDRPDEVAMIVLEGGTVYIHRPEFRFAVMRDRVLFIEAGSLRIEIAEALS